MNGILPVDKPERFTSFDVIGKLRGVTHTKKIGHSGTLDPMATGVLPLFFGNATKALSVLPDEDKAYVAEVFFGVTTATEDMTGEILTKTDSRVTEQEFTALFPRFCGEIKQIPPMVSAVKVGGQPLYKLARQGKEIEREARKISVYAINLLEFDEEAQKAKIEVSCGKGTYIRTLIADMGKALGCGAAMGKLRRTKAGSFCLSDCLTIGEVCERMKNGTLEEALLPIERLFEHLPKLVLNDFDEHLYRNGVPLELQKRGWEMISGTVAVYNKKGEILGLSEMDEKQNELTLIKLFRSNND